MGRKPAVCTMGGAKFCRFALFPLMLLMLLLLPAGMVAQTEASCSKYIATYESSTQTLTFKKNVGETLPENSAWVEDKQMVSTINKKLGNGTIAHIVFDKSFGTYTPTSLYCFFENLPKLETITGLEYLNTEKVTNMSRMFYYCSKLTSLDVTHFNTENVTDMGYMFLCCSKLSSLDVSHFNTAKVTKMNSMFSSCSKLTSLDVTHFNTEKVTEMNSMFYNCSSLTSLDVSHFNTAKVTKMDGIFSGCSKLTSLDVTHFDTEKVTDMNKMFYDCSSLTSLDVSKFNTANVTDMSRMFFGCSKLTSLDVSKFNTANVTVMYSMFCKCSSLTSLDVSKFNTANVKNMNSMFTGCSELTSLDVSNFNTANVRDMYYMFAGCLALTSLDVTNFNTANVTNMSGMFFRCSELTSLDVTNFNTANVTDMSSMFCNCVALTSLYLTNFNTEKVKYMKDMFAACRALTTIYASSKFVTPQVSNSSGMFNYCEKLKGEVEEWTDDKATDKTYAKIEGGYFSGGIPRVKYADGTLTFFLTSKETLGENEYELNSGKNLPEWVKKHSLGITKVVFDTSFANARPTSCYKWFWWCDKLKQVEGIKNLNTKEVTDMVDMFCDCRDFSSLDVSGFNTGKVTDMSGMFYECISLKLLDVAKFNTANVKSMSNMFYNCQNLASLNVTNFNTANVTNMQGMFSGCPALTTIYASDKFVTGQVTDGSNMFSNCINLKGFIDCKNNSDKTDHTYANYKTGYFTKLVGKNGDEKIGATGETLATDNLVLDDNKDFVAYEPFAAKAASYNRTMNTGTTWGTLCLPFGIAQSQETECKFYRLIGIDNECITLESYEGAEIPAGTPVLFKMNENEQTLSISVQNADLVKEPVAGTNTDVNLVGSFTKIGGKDNQGLDKNDYIIGKDKFWLVSELKKDGNSKGVGIKPMRAYIHPATAAQARAAMLSIGKGDGTTAIDNLNAISNDANAEYYDANGRRTNGLQKGLNIVKRGSKTYKIMVK